MLLKRLSIFWKNTFKKLLYPLGFTVLVFLLFFLPGRLIKINKVNCESQYGDCPTEVKNSLDIQAGGNLTRAKSSTKKELNESRLVSEYSIQYEFPDSLKVNILLKKPRYAAFNKNTGKYLLIGETGEILSIAESTSLPTVIQSSDEPNLTALSLMEGVFAMYQVSKGEIITNSLVVELPTHVRVRFPLDGIKSNESLLGSLRLIYSQVTDKEIDLRFKNALLR